MKKMFCVWIAMFVVCAGRAQIPQTKQSDFEKYVEEQGITFDRYSRSVDDDFKNYNDSINEEYGKYLAEVWSHLDLRQKEPPIKNPAPPAVYNPDAPQPAPHKTPVVGEVERPAPPPYQSDGVKPRPDITQTPVRVPHTGLNISFFGTPVVLNQLDLSVPALSGVTEKEVAAYWNALSRSPYTDWTIKMKELKASLALNDWGMYLLINHAFDAYFPDSTENEQVIFAVFTLNQLGYRAKIGRSGRELVPLIAFGCNVFNTSYFIYGNEQGINYSVVNTKHKQLTSIETCPMEYAGATKLMDLSMSSAPMLAVSVAEKTLKVWEKAYELKYNRNMIDFYATYPCADYTIYAESPLEATFRQSVEECLLPNIRQLSQEDAINVLLHFVQFAFEYKADGDYYGYERWFFAEETIASSFSDCEDRSFLFAQLVRRLIGMPVVLLYYPGRHLATAVRFDNPATKGDYLMVDGQKYLICDPTYIGASLGMGMPNLRAMPIQIIKLKKTN